MRRPSLLIIFFTLLILPLLCVASEESTGIQRHKVNIGKLRQAIEKQKGRIDDSGQKEMTLLEELEEIDGRIQQQKEKIKGIQEQIEQQEFSILAKQIELLAIDKEKRLLQQHLIHRLRAYYRTGSTNLLDITFSSQNLPDILLFDEAFRSLLTYDQQIFDAYREKKKQVREVKRTHELERSVQLGFLNRADEEREILAFIAEEKNRLLKKTKSRKHLFEQALKEMKKAEEDLTSTIKQLKIKEHRKTQGFLMNKGKLAWPASGLLLSRFNPDTAGKEVSTDNGISIKTSEGAAVSSVYKGKVIFAEYMRGFGKTVIIDHGFEYYTVTARLDSISVQKGTTVSTGDLIGTTGDIATLFGRGLYFEVRQGSGPVDPLQWLIPGG